jgi:1A family penicillin-binding protein
MKKRLNNIKNTVVHDIPRKMKNIPKKVREVRKDKKKMKKILNIGFIVLGVGLLLVIGTFAFYMKDLPDPGKINKRLVAESTKIYDRTGEHLLYELHGEEKRTIVQISEIPDSVKYATIALEDQSFYSHAGIDFRGILRAVVKDVIHVGAAQGGSTITQQFIKNSILTSEKRISRKIKEVILAIGIEQKFTKDEILQMYLNEIPYGSNAYGIEAAAQTFFGTHARDLTLSQAALLACLPNASTYYSPLGSHTDRLLVRWEHALNEMASLGYITKEQAEEAKSEDILAQVRSSDSNMKAPHFVLYVKEQLVEEFGEEEVEKKGLKVYTTLDWDLQQKAERAVREGVEKIGDKYNFSNAALVAISPKNGQVLSMVGSKDYFNEEIDGNVNVAIRLRQPGSSFKPYVYAEAFRKGYRPDTIIFDVNTNFSTDSGKPYNPKNYDNTNRGPVKMKKALAMSLNVPAVKVLYLAGIKDSIKLAKDMGITSLNNPSRYGLALVLGGGEVKLIDHVSAFSVFANQGVKQEKTAILRIEDADGKVLKNYEKQKGKKVLEKNVALQITDILSNNNYRAAVFGTDNNLNIPGKQVAAKTGTTNEWRDGWLVGATPNLAAGVWTGNNDNTSMADGADGSYTAGPIWKAFMIEALKNSQNGGFEKPKDDYDESDKKTDKPVMLGTLEVEEKIEVCKYKSGKYCLANKYCPDDEKEEKKFSNAHCILYYVDINDPLGDYPKDPGDDPQYKNWEKAVQKWAKKENGKKIKSVPERECEKKDFDDYFSRISIESPNNGSTIDEQTIKIKTDVSGDADVDQVDFFFDGKSIGSRKSKPYDLEYKIPVDKNGQDIEIKAKVYDEGGEDDEDSVVVKINF